jgi:hypothetical protein
LHPHCIHPSTFEHYFATKRQSLPIPDHNVFSWRRNNVLIEVIELGYNIIFTVWFLLERNFFRPKVISNLRKHNSYAVQKYTSRQKCTFFQVDFDREKLFPSAKLFLKVHIREKYNFYAVRRYTSRQ